MQTRSASAQNAAYIRLHDSVLEIRDTFMRASEDIGAPLSQVFGVLASWLQPLEIRLYLETRHGNREVVFMAYANTAPWREVVGGGTCGAPWEMLGYLLGDIVRCVGGGVRRVYAAAQPASWRYRALRLRLEFSRNWLVSSEPPFNLRGGNAVYAEGDEELLGELYKVVKSLMCRPQRFKPFTLVDAGSCRAPCKLVIYADVYANEIEALAVKPLRNWPGCVTGNNTIRMWCGRPCVKEVCPTDDLCSIIMQHVRI